MKEPKIIAITGTVGKTTTKDILYAGLSDSLSVRKSPKGFNSDIGVLLTVLNLDTHKASVLQWVKNIIKGFFVVFSKTYPELLIIEVGANYPGEIRKNAKLLRPDVAVFTKLPDIMAHMEFFENRQHFVDEKLSLARFTKKGGWIIYNGDDETLQKEFENEDFNSYNKKTFGRSADFVFKDVMINQHNDVLRGTDVLIYDDSKIHLQGVLGEHLGYSVTALLLVSSVLNFREKDTIKSLQKNFAPAPGRMRVFEVKDKKATIIDDSYNALPESVKNGSDILKGLNVSGRKIYVLGRLAELGEYTEESYETAVRYIRESCDVIFLVNDGEVAKKYAQKLNFKEIYNFNEHGEDFFANTDDAGRFLKDYIKDGDVLIFKGARHSTGFERAVSQLIKEEDVKYLVQDHL
ncbi:MAG: Mur ligase family protein [Patescibacteria group bacterium]